MPPHRNNPRSNRPAGHLLLLGCSERKRVVKGKLPALDLYDGVNFRVLRTFLHERGWPPGLCIKILSAKYGLIDATDLIETYDQRLDKATACKMNRRVLKSLARFGKPSSVFVNLGKDYLPAIEGIDPLFQKQRIVHAEGGIGLKMAHMKRWLNSLPSKTATLPGKRSDPSYLYFFPDWDDYVTEPFVHETAQEDPTARTTKKYAHEVFGADDTPYDGMLVSLAQIYTGKGTLSRLDADTAERSDLRKAMKIPKRLLLFGDCGAFSYAFEDKPPFSPEQAAHLYHRFGFDIGASVDHIPLPEIVVENEKGELVKRILTEEERRGRMRLTARNAEAFLAACRRHRYKFLPLGVIQGIDTKSYVRYVHKYIDMGYQHIALGGLVPKSDSEIIEICCAVRDAIQTRTRTEKESVWLHLFGILRPKIQSSFRLLGVSSFDSASYLRKAWLRSDQNYLAGDGSRWYSAIRVPISSSKRLREAAEEQDISEDSLRKMENRCLVALNNFDGSKKTHQEVVDSVNLYGPLLERRGEDNHFFEKHDAVLNDRPWEKCRCQVCRDIGIDVVVFRGTGRNKRRGFHNTWVFYHKILHGK
ncbi:MAG: tRNA-guanine transglycosylase DpdA [Planctomycetota bacterium]